MSIAVVGPLLAQRLVACLLAQHFSTACLGQLRQEEDAAVELLVFHNQTLGHILNNVHFSEATAGYLDHSSGSRIAIHLVPQAKDTGLDDVGQLGDHLLQLVGTVLGAMEAQHVALAFDNVQKVLVVKVSHVAGVEPALVVLYMFRFVGIAIVAIPHAAVVHQNLTSLAVSQTPPGIIENFHLHSRYDFAHRRGLCHAHVRCHASAFGQRITVRYLAIQQVILQLQQIGHIAVAAANANDANTGQSLLAECGRLQQGRDLLWRHGQQCDLVLLDQLQHVLGRIGPIGDDARRAVATAVEHVEETGCPVYGAEREQNILSSYEAEKIEKNIVVSVICREPKELLPEVKETSGVRDAHCLGQTRRAGGAEYGHSLIATQ